MSVRVLVVTGTRAEFGLLEPVMRAVDAHPELELRVAACGLHLLEPARTLDEVRRRVRVDAVVEMQRHSEIGRIADARALGRGILGLTQSIEELEPDWVVVLGDRIEAFAAASAASVAGVLVAHLHGGDRAEGIADEAMRHAITKLANLHLPATSASAERIIRMGESTELVRVIGSPAIDALASVAPMSDADLVACGSPDTVFLLHPIGRTDEAERAVAAEALRALHDRRVLALHPNHDAGRIGIVAAIRDAGVLESQHMPRDAFLSLLARLASTGGLLVGNSSAGLIECAALKLPVISIGRRQNGREMPDNVFSCDEDAVSISTALGEAAAVDRAQLSHPYGDGNAGVRAAEALAEMAWSTDRADLLRKQCSY